MHVWTFEKINVYGFSSYRFTAIVKRRGMHILKIVKTAAFCKIKKNVMKTWSTKDAMAFTDLLVQL